MRHDTFKQGQKHDDHVLLQIQQLLQQSNLTGVLQESQNARYNETQNNL